MNIGKRCVAILQCIIGHFKDGGDDGDEVDNGRRVGGVAVRTMVSHPSLLTNADGVEALPAASASFVENGDDIQIDKLL